MKAFQSQSQLQPRTQRMSHLLLWPSFHIQNIQIYFEYYLKSVYLQFLRLLVLCFFGIATVAEAGDTHADSVGLQCLHFFKAEVQSKTNLEANLDSKLASKLKSTSGLRFPYTLPNRDGSGTHPVQIIDPVVFEPTDAFALTWFFQENGYVVLDHVSEAKDRDAVVTLIDQVAARFPEARRLGFMDIYHDATLAQLRQNPVLYTVFTKIFDSPHLWVVFDRVMYWNSNEGEQPLPPHVDQNPIQNPQFFNAQAMLALRDMNEGTGTLALVQGSHLDFAKYQQWSLPNVGFVEYQGIEPLPFVALRLKEGQIVIWDSRTTHSRFRAKAQGTRYAALVTYTPAQNSEDLVARRLKYFAAGIGWNDHRAGLRATARPRYEQSLRQNIEILTPLGRKLYGLENWFDEGAP